MCAKVTNRSEKKIAGQPVRTRKLHIRTEATAIKRHAQRQPAKLPRAIATVAIEIESTSITA